MLYQAWNHVQKSSQAINLILYYTSLVLLLLTSNTVQAMTATQSKIVNQHTNYVYTAMCMQPCCHARYSTTHLTCGHDSC
jgi:hypothetical protein